MKSLIGLALLLTLMAGPVLAADDENFAMAHVRFSTELAMATGCIRLGQVLDDSVKDLRRKIVRTGGDTGILSFGTDKMYAQVFRCAGVAAPPASNTVPDIPPPPRGTPPPPPPGISQ